MGSVKTGAGSSRNSPSTPRRRHQRSQMSIRRSISGLRFWVLMQSTWRWPRRIEMIQHPFDAAIGKQADRRQAVAGEIAVENHHFVRPKRLDQPWRNLRSVGDDERSLGLLDRFDDRLLIPMDELRRTQTDAALRCKIGDEAAQLREVARRIRRTEQHDLGRFVPLREARMHVERAGGVANQHLLVEQFLDGAARGHVADAGFLGDLALAGNAVEQVVTLRGFAA